MKPMSNPSEQPASPLAASPADLERRFGGLRRLYGDAGYRALRGARVAVVGVGGVGSWAAEALARSGVAALTLIDLDHVAESNINRQVHALESTLGQAKVLALKERISQIHPGCEVAAVDEFATEENAALLLGGSPLDGVLECCDQVRAKAAVAAWCLQHAVPLVAVGAAGGKRSAPAVEVADLAETTHDPLLASVRQRLRQKHGAARKGPIGVRCVFSREPVLRPVSDAGESCDIDSSLNCHGYGSSVAVTAVFGLTAAGEMLNTLAARNAVGSPVVVDSVAKSWL